MFDDLDLEAATALRTSIRAAWMALVQGQQPSAIKYGEHGENFHPASVEGCERVLALVNARIAALNGCGGGPLIAVTR